MSLATRRLRRRVQPHLGDGEQYQAAARDASGIWWVVTDQALLIADRFGHPQRRVPRGEILEVQAADRRNVRIKTAHDGILIGSLNSNAIGESLAR